MYKRQVTDSESNPAIAGEALRYLIANPPAGTPDSDPARMPWLNRAVDYVTNLAINNPTAGSEWVESLPDGQTKLWSQLNLHFIWTKYDPKAADGWLKSLPAETQVQVKNLGKKPANR